MQLRFAVIKPAFIILAVVERFRRVRCISRAKNIFLLHDFSARADGNRFKIKSCYRVGGCPIIEFIRLIVG